MSQTEAKDPNEFARPLAITILNSESHRTPESIHRAVSIAAQVTKLSGYGDVDEELLVARLMYEGNIYVPNATLMDDPTDHVEWLPSRRGGISWTFWSRYQEFIEKKKGLPTPVVSALNTLTDDILAKLEDPLRPAPWDCRGMVVGSVQSGKTANYCGLICKAIDAGYKLIVVLAGMHNNLRSQTQYRIDEGVLGRDSQKERRLNQENSLIGVGKLFGEPLPIHTLTSSLENGDFRAPKADTGVTIGGDPVVLVIKKNGSVLRNLQRWVVHMRGEESEAGGKKVVRNVPLLVIDDEADNASVNTKEKKGKPGSDEDVTAINGRIRELLDAFDKSAYVGYTATPFANIFINPEAATKRHGEDLFPRSFILNVSPPSNYIGPSKVFGLDGDPDAGIDPSSPLPLVRTIGDYESIFPPKHDKELTVTSLPHSLETAIHCFLLSCAARRARGQKNVHNSMLVHVTRFVQVQHKVAELIQHQVHSIRRRITLGEGDRKPGLLDELHGLWKEEFVPITASTRTLLPEEEIQTLTWADILAELGEAAARIEVREINGSAKEALDYVAHSKGFSVISVGGDKLSRGLTLEGLSVSYFLRASKMYDTLMQMGRWFGYRPGYVDLCRLYTTDELSKWYRHIAQAEIELRREFDKMKAAGMTPEDFGLRVREHPDGLLVTALNKMAHAQTQRLSYAGQLVQTAHFSTDPIKIARNASVVERFLLLLGGKDTSAQLEKKKPRIWKRVNAEVVMTELLANFDVVTENWRFQKIELVEFIRRQTEIGELTNWTVVLIDAASKSPEVSVANMKVQAVQRSPQSGTWNELAPTIFSTSNSNIQSPNHQAIDLFGTDLTAEVLNSVLAKRGMDGKPLFVGEEEQVLKELSHSGSTLGHAAETLTQLRSPRSAQGSTTVNGEVARQLRPSTHGLLLIYPIVPVLEHNWASETPFFGLVLSFPSSHTAKAVNYKVNKVWQSTFQDDDYVDGD